MWPKLKQFLADNGVAVAYDAPENGRLNTGWLRVEQTQYRDVIRTLLRDAKNGANLNQGMDRYLKRYSDRVRAEVRAVFLLFVAVVMSGSVRCCVSTMIRLYERGVTRPLSE